MANKISVIIDVTVDKANRAITSFKKSVTDADGAVGKFKAGAASAGASLKANIVPVAAAAGAAVATFAAKSIKAASDLGESTNAVEKTFGSTAEAVLKIGENAAESFGLSKAEFNGAAVAFSAFAKEVAGPGGDVADVIEDLTRRSADFASVMNIDVAEAALVFRSGLSGETEPLKRFGIVLSAAAVEAHALATGMVESKSEMTEAIKVQARYELLMKKTAFTANDFADTSDGLANSTRIANKRMIDFQATVGEQLIPVVETSLGLVLDLADAMDALKVSAGGAGEALDKDRGFVEGLTNALENQLNPWQAVLQAYNSYAGAGDDAAESTDGLDHSLHGLSQSLVQAAIDEALLERATENATKLAEDQAAAIDEVTAAAERRIQASKDELAAQDALNDATLSAIDSSLGYRNQVARTTSTIATANAVTNNAKSSTEELAQAARDAEGAVLDQAGAAVRLAEDQAKANGQMLTADEKTKIYKAELGRLVGTLNGDAAFAIQMHIDRLNAIPRSIRTTITQKFGSLGRADYTQPGFGSRRARGGPVSAGEAYLVGEEGPEVLQMGASSGKVIPNDKLGGMGGNTIINNYPAGWRDADDITNGRRRYDRIQGPM